jgi:hypothetical protein
MTFNFRTELEHLAAQITRHPLTDVLAYEIREPATDALIQDVEAKFGRKIPRSVADLYRLVNGVTLRWRFKEDLDEPTRDRIIEEFAPDTSAPENVFLLAGSIELAPLENVLLHEDYTLPQIEEENDEFVFDGVTYSDNEFCGMLRIFDAVSQGSAMAFVTQPDVDAWKLMWLTDDWLVYDSSRVTWLEDYLRLVIATWGLVTARDSMFVEYRGYEDEPVTFDEQSALALLPEILSAL